jgi:hypothetical protein
MGGLGTAIAFHSISKINKQTFVKHRIIAANDLVEATGTDLIELTLDMHFHGPYTLAPSAGIAALEAVMAAKIPLPLIIGRIPVGRGLFSLFVIEAIDSKMTHFAGSGLAAADVTLKLLEYPNPLGALGPLSALGGALPGLSGIVGSLNNIASIAGGLPGLAGISGTISNAFSSVTGGIVGLSNITASVSSAITALQPGGISGVVKATAAQLQGAVASLTAAGKASSDTVPK